MTLAEFRGIKGPRREEEGELAHGEEAVVVRERPHPSPLEYAQIGLALAIITAIEVGVYYIEALDDVLVPILIALSLTKFSLVVMWFMHLRFDNRLLSAFFTGGLILAMSIFVVVLSTFGASLV